MKRIIGYLLLVETVLVVAACTVAPAPVPKSTATTSIDVAPAKTLTPEPTALPIQTAPLNVSPAIPQPTPSRLPIATGTSITPATPSSTPIYGAPVLFDPPDARTFSAKNTILRWRTDYDLKPDEVFDVLIWLEGRTSKTSLGNTRDKSFPVDFLTWGLAATGKFFWEVRVKRANGTYVSAPGQPFSFILTEPPPPTLKLYP